MVWPVPLQYRITTAYGERGKNWSCNKNASGGIHTGADLKAPRGTPIYATIAGEIRHRSYGAAFGPYQFAISPDPDQPFGKGEVFYAHVLSRLPNGTRVVPGQRISEVGDLGNATGPHLHYEYHPTSKNVWSCNTHANPQVTLDAQPEGPAVPPPGAWQFPAGKKVYAKYLKWDGHELNSDKVSDSIKAWQEMLNKHSLAGGSTLPITGKFWTQTAEETQKCQTQHMPPADDPLTTVYVGPRQWAHVKQDTKCPYDFVLDDTAETSPVPPVQADRPAQPLILYPGAIWDPIAKTGGGYFTGLGAFEGSAKKITLHTTETRAKPNWAAQQSGIPHMTVDLKTRQIWQHLSFSTAAYTMKGGEHSVNKDSGQNIQIEIIGYTVQCPTWTVPEYNNLKEILVWLHHKFTVPYVFPWNFATAAHQTWNNWESTSGILGHCHAPYNDHSDPKGLNTNLLALGAPVTPPEPVQPLPTPPDDEYVTTAEFNAFKKEVQDWMRELVGITVETIDNIR